MRPLLALLALALASPALADDALAGAQRAYADVDYPKCKDEAQKALAAPGDKAARVEAWRLLGLCTAALGDTENAREAFKRMLAIDRDARLPDGLSPRFTSSYREAKGSFLTGAPIAFTVEQTTDNGGTRTVRFKLVDELGLVQKIAWRGAAGSSGGPVRAAPLFELELPAEVDVTVVGLDPQGGEVALFVLPARKAEAPPPPPPATTEEGGGFPWLVVGGVAGGVLVLAGAAAYALLAPPTSVNVKTDVAFPQ
jgi:hypothetical protein